MTYGEFRAFLYISGFNVDGITWSKGNIKLKISKFNNEIIIRLPRHGRKRRPRIINISSPDKAMEYLNGHL